MLRACISSKMRGINRWGREIVPNDVSNALWTACQKSTLGQYIFLYIKRKMGSLSLYMCIRDSNSSVFTKPIKIAVKNRNFGALKQVGYHLIRKFQSREIYNMFEKPNLGTVIPISRDCFTLELCPSMAVHHPDRFLEHGDEVFVECRLLGFRYFHSGIYHRGGFVYHFVGLLDSECEENTFRELLRPIRNCRGAIVFDSWKHFIGTLGKYENIYRCQHFLRVRSGDQVIKVARKMQMQRQYFTQYDLRFCNCQHFTSFCTRGVAYSYDMSNKLKYFACSLLSFFQSSKNVEDSCPKKTDA